MSTLSEAQSVIQQIEKHSHQKVDTETKEKMLKAIKGKSKKESQKQLSAFNPYVEIPKSKEKVITDKLTKIEIVIDESTQKLLNEVKSLLSHEIHDGDLSLIFKKSLEIASEFLSKKKGVLFASQSAKSSDLATCLMHSTDFSQLTSISHSKKISELNDSIEPHLFKETHLTTDGGFSISGEEQNNLKHKSSRYISIKVKRLVFVRAHNCCEYISPDGVKCNSQFKLQIDHILPFSRGGKSDKNNLQVLCRTHNLMKGSS